MRVKGRENPADLMTKILNIREVEERLPGNDAEHDQHDALTAGQLGDPGAALPGSTPPMPAWKPQPPNDFPDSSLNVRVGIRVAVS